MTAVSKFVAQSACRNYRNARSRWRNPNIRANKPVFHKKNRTGAGSFLAASGIACIQYDHHRRIRLPYLGSVRITRTLPEGIPHEVTISKQNGRWFASIAYWKPPMAPPQRETQSVGGSDVGINPLAMDSDGTAYQNPRALYLALRKLRRWQRAQARRTCRKPTRQQILEGKVPKNRGWHEAQQRIDAIQRRNVQSAPAGTLQGPAVRRPHCGSRPTVPQQQDLLRLRRREPGPSPGTPMAMPRLWTTP